MSYAARETSVCAGEPYECYWWSCGGLSWRQASGDTERVISGYTYERQAITRTEIEQNDELNSGGITVTLDVENVVAKLFRGFLPSRPVFLVIYAGHDGDSEVVTTFIGKVSSCVFTDTAALKCVPDQDALKRAVPGVTYQSQCPRRLFSAGCGLAADAYMVMATLTASDGKTLVSPTFALHASGYFRGGWLDLNGTARPIKSHVGDTVVLMDPLADLVVGSEVIVYPGCQYTEEYCHTVFNNLPNFDGDSHIPTVNPFADGGLS